ncbi:hypothetical protein IMG5_104050 [Ichthyophthirius multifiliis]|uniref:Transmembrane protein n=1 Tax=Ichthyophthirius multifiliis TaxID=5932 RepID=G0QSV8_ICHMU|nr:hypothetical protein IMG5_104050 [Ichthyophthirius multifiliis]EGR31691.1 hypothetical protein IMG5_104050 [Ichthyophthirius multifiliis]|eukprot:XP_004035177.1 hypothetical protein IMG5_104050 [Ichthyophthirius multifiliis]
MKNILKNQSSINIKMNNIKQNKKLTYYFLITLSIHILKQYKVNANQINNIQLKNFMMKLNSIVRLKYTQLELQSLDKIFTNNLNNQKQLQIRIDNLKALKFIIKKFNRLILDIDQFQIKKQFQKAKLQIMMFQFLYKMEFVQTILFLEENMLNQLLIDKIKQKYIFSVLIIFFLIFFYFKQKKNLFLKIFFFFFKKKQKKLYFYLKLYIINLQKIVKKQQKIQRKTIQRRNFKQNIINQYPLNNSIGTNYKQHIKKQQYYHKL